MMGNSRSEVKDLIRLVNADAILYSQGGDDQLFCFWEGGERGLLTDLNGEVGPWRKRGLIEGDWGF